MSVENPKTIKDSFKRATIAAAILVLGLCFWMTTCNNSELTSTVVRTPTLTWEQRVEQSVCVANNDPTTPNFDPHFRPIGTLWQARIALTTLTSDRNEEFEYYVHHRSDNTWHKVRSLSFVNPGNFIYQDDACFVPTNQ